jgi:hypothetical protein
MFSAEFDGLRHWSFIDLYHNNEDTYRRVYQEAYRSLRGRIPSDPSMDDLEHAVYGMVITEGNFIYHCNSKHSFNPKFTPNCAEKFAKLIVYNHYRR